MSIVTDTPTKGNVVPADALQFALQYARCGWNVFPINYPIGDGCSCGKADCDRIGKHPMADLAPHGLKDGTTDLERIRSWFTRRPQANIATRTSKADGLFMVGPDGAEGIEQFANLQAIHGELPRTSEAYSGGGGKHHVFRWPGDAEIKNGFNIHGTKIDVRGEGGYFVTPPSLHKSGSRYDWIRPPWEVRPADPPDWFVKWILFGPKLKPDDTPRHERNGKATGDTHTAVIGRAIQYLAKCKPAISGQGGHSATMSVARAIVFGFGLGPVVGKQLMADYWNSNCQPPWSDRELEHKCTDADTTADPDGRPRGYLLKPRGGSKKNESEIGSKTEPISDGPKDATTIILEYFRRTYKPLFKRGNSIVADNGREIGMGEVTSIPRPALVEALKLATNVPCYKGGVINENAIAGGFFRTWAKVAWGALLDELEEEDDVKLGADGPVQEEFCRLVREALLRQIKLGMTIKVNGIAQMQNEVRSLIDWAWVFAKRGPWKSVRSYRLWCKLVPGETPNQNVLMVALRAELFSQLGADRRLIDMGANRFTRRCSQYGIGDSSQTERVHGKKAVILNPAFVLDLVTDFTTDDGGEVPEG